MKAYKCFPSDLTLGGVRYEVSKTYSSNMSEMHGKKFTAYKKIDSALNPFLEFGSVVYCEVCLSGVIDEDCGKLPGEVHATEMTIQRILTNGEVAALLGGLFKVRRLAQWNFINAKGLLVSDTWFDFAWDYGNGYALVHLNGKKNIINSGGEYITQWGNLLDDIGHPMGIIERWEKNRSENQTTIKHTQS